MRTLTLPLKAEYFYQIKSGEKKEEYRLCSEYWTKRIVGKEYDKIVLTLGYPSKDDKEKRIERPWHGYLKKIITHPHFGNERVEVFAIKVN